MSKNRHLAIYPQSQFSAILFTPKDLSPLELTEVDIFRSAGSVIDCHHPPNFPSHPIFALLKSTPPRITKKHTTQNGGEEEKRKSGEGAHHPKWW